MGNLAGKFWKRTVNILITGLDNAGKATIYYQITNKPGIKNLERQCI